MGSLYDRIKENNAGTEQIKPIVPIAASYQKPQGFARTTFKAATGAALPALKSYIDSEEEKRSQMTLGQKAKYDLVQKPASIIKFLAQGAISVPLSLGRSIQEAVGMEVSKPTGRALEWEKKIFGGEVDSYQQITRNIQDVIDESPESTLQEKKFLAPTIGLALFAADMFPGKGKKSSALKLVEEIAADTSEKSIRNRLIKIGVEKEMASRLGTTLAKETNPKNVQRTIAQLSANEAIRLTDEAAGAAASATKKQSLLDRVAGRVINPKSGEVPGEVRTPKAKLPDAPDVPESSIIKRADQVNESEVERFFRASAGNNFEEVAPDSVVPAFIREDLDTFVVKQGDEFNVVEGRTGQQIGEGGRTVAEAVQNAKSEVEAIGPERLSEFVNNSPLSPRYTQVAEKTPGIPKNTQKDTKIQLPEGVITADQLRTTDKAAARRLAKLENMAKKSPDVDSFVDTTGITRQSLDRTVQKQGYKDAEQFFNTNRPEKMSKAEAAARSKSAEPDTRMAPDDEAHYSLLAEQEAGDSFALAVRKEEAEGVVVNLRAVFADMKGIDLQDPSLKFTDEDLFKAQTEYEFIMDSLMDDPARALSKYANANGELPEVLGGEFRTVLKNGKQVRVRNSEFGRRGDDIITELGFESSEEAREAYTKYLKRKADAQEVLDNLRKVRNSIRLAKQMDNFVETNQKKLAAEFMKNRKALTAIVEAAERAGFRKGVAKGDAKMEKLVNRLRSRRQTISGIKFRYNLSPAEMRKAQEAAQREMKDLAIPDDPRFMTKDEFTEYTKQMEIAATDLEMRRNERGMVKAIIEQKELKNAENLREVMGLPTLSEMNLEQLGRYEKVLNKFQDGDEFLSKRTLEVIDRTALKGARTVRQVQQFLSQEIKRVLGRDVKPGELGELTAGAADYLRWDTSLAESKPFYGFLVNRTQKHMMEGEANFLRLQSRVEELAAAAKKSRVKANKTKIKQLRKELRETTDSGARKAIKQRMKKLGWRANAKQKVVPTYTRIINYLEARGDEKDMWLKTLTKEEQEYARFVRNYYNSAYNYLSYINELHGSRYIDAYFTHVRKGFLEKWSDDGFVAALKNMWDAQKEDMAIANIIDSDTGKILPKSKFFQYTLKRSGEGEVSQNLTRVFLQYSKLLERKKMLDKMIPELDVYTSSLTPKEMTQRGLEMDRTMKEFVNNYLNNKRGRRFNYGGIVKQNGPADIMLRSGNTLVSFLDLGLNFLAGSASMVGEQVANFVALGNRGTLKGFKRRIWDTGMKRLVDPKAADILKQAEPFIGRNIWTEIGEVDKPIFEKAMQTMFGMFGQSSVEANKIYLLGSLTKQELKAGKISAQRMADLKLEAGRWRDMGSEIKSIVGATSPGASFTKYKTWALPIMRTTIKDITTTADRLKKGNFKEAVTAKETKEIMRAIEATAAAIIVGNLITSEEDDDSALSKLRARVKQEALTILGGVDPTVFLATPRLYSWLQQLAGNLKQIVLLEEYKTDSKYGVEGDLKGVGGLKQQFLPSFIRQFMPSNSSESTASSTSKAFEAPPGLPALPNTGAAALPKLPSLPSVQ